MFIFLESDNFEQGSRQAAEWGLESQHREDLKEWAAIRRPYRGIQIKKDTYATISVRSPGGSPLPLVSSSAVGGAPGQGLVAEYSDFILQGVVDSRAEKTQIIETFGETYAYFYGEKPRFLKFNGLLMNTEDFNWRAQFWHNYDTFFRGSKLVEKNARLYLAYDTIVVEGYAIEAIAQDDSDDPYSVPFTVTMLLTNYHEYSTVGATKFPGIPADSLDVLNDELDKKEPFGRITMAEVKAMDKAGLTFDGNTYSRDEMISLFKRVANAQEDGQVAEDKISLDRQQWLKAQSCNWAPIWLWPSVAAFVILAFFALAFRDKPREEEGPAEGPESPERPGTNEG